MDRSLLAKLFALLFYIALCVVLVLQFQGRGSERSVIPDAQPAWKLAQDAPLQTVSVRARRLRPEGKEAGI